MAMRSPVISINIPYAFIKSISMFLTAVTLRTAQLQIRSRWLFTVRREHVLRFLSE